MANILNITLFKYLLISYNQKLINDQEIIHKNKKHRLTSNMNASLLKKIKLTLTHICIKNYSHKYHIMYVLNLFNK